MVKLTIDSIPVEIEEGASILDAARLVGISLPNLCFLKGLNEIGACRVCVVEVKGTNKLVSACNNMVEEGMEVFTNTPKVREARRINVELILSQHDCYCAACVRSGNCSLQSIANDLGIVSEVYAKNVPYGKWNKDFPLIRDEAKCIKCMRCVQVCDKVASINIWDVINTGSRTTVGVTHHRNIEDTECTLCSQCITACPVGALRERDDTYKAFEALSDPDKITVVQLAPAVRVAWGEGLGLSMEKATVGRLVAALRRMGFDYIFDTNFTADLTIMEEGCELIERMKHRSNYKYPMFTSCCPGWIRFIKSQYPDLVKNLSTSKSPQQMFGALTKTYFANLLNVDPEKIYSISIMPCVAKKQEAALPNMNDAGAGQDVDLVLTTREITRMIKSMWISPLDLPEEDFNAPLGVSSGAGVIFGATGGVMEAALRSAYYIIKGENPPVNAFENVRGLEAWREADFIVDDIKIRAAVVSGLANTRELIEGLIRGEVEYDFVEVMACPGGCSGGGGQPIHDGELYAGIRAKQLYKLDQNAEIRFSHDNPAVQNLYQGFIGSPCSEKSHQLLHTNHNDWQMPSQTTKK